MSTIGFRIKSKVQRPDKELVQGFKGLPVANIADCMNRVACVDSSIRPFNKVPLLGTAFTVKATGGDNLLFHKALDMAAPGDVLVIAGGGTMKRSYCGEIMVRYAISKGLSGFIVDGCIRDSDAISELDFPVYAKGCTPDGPYKNGPGEIGYPVSFAGQVMHPGDILVGDGDGIVVINPDEAAELLRETKAVLEKEQKILTDISAGLGMDRKWIDEALENKGCLNLGI